MARTAIPQICRTYYLDMPATEKIAARARDMRDRAGVLSGYALGEAEDAEARDVLADVAAVFGDDPGLHWESWPTGSPTAGRTGGPT